jgi:hypothetical protein
MLALLFFCFTRCFYLSQCFLLCTYQAPHMPLHCSLCLFLIVVLLATYYVWDTSQSQKNHFRLQCSGVEIERIGWLPWQILKNPKHIKTKRGTPLLVDGWWAYARKIHYTVRARDEVCGVEGVFRRRCKRLSGI